MTSLKVVITDYEYATLAEEKAVFERIGIELIPAQCKTEDEVIEAAKDADGILNQYAPITEKVIKNLPKCKVISRYGIGVDTVDVKAATEHGIIVSNVTDYCWEEVADHAITLLLSYARKVVRLNQTVKNKQWDYKLGTPIYRLRDRTLGLVGLGNIPQLVAERAQVFGLKVMAYDPFVSQELADSLNVDLVSLDDLCKQSDYISVHAPLNQQTRGMISDEQFNSMKKEAIIINTARGPVIDEQALVHALHTKTIAGAALDVVEQEPIPSDHPLLELENVTLTPHVAWHSEESGAELQRKTAQNVADVLTGYYPSYLVNKELRTKVSLKEKEGNE